MLLVLLRQGRGVGGDRFFAPKLDQVLRGNRER